MTRESARAPVGAIRRYYESRKVPITPTARARADVLAILEDRRAIQRAGEALMHAVEPFSGDPGIRKAIEDFRAVLEGRARP